jgi:GR25 family glycosyltransferase involved in LPS biosynthesis
MFKFPRSFCVTLKETPMRTKSFLQEAKKAEIPVELFYGLFGQRVRLTPRLPNDLECPGQNVFLTDGAVGCYLSHLILWNVLQHLPEEEFLILEDDAVFVDGFKERFEHYYNRLPANWDMVYIGWLPYDDDQRKVIVDDGIVIRQPAATHGYLIKKSALRLACDVIQPCSAPLDLTIGAKLLPCLKYFVLDPPLITQRSYLNSNDAIWNSLVYDWKRDLYGVKAKILRKLMLVDGWHGEEQDGTGIWRWSEQTFSISVPANIENITLFCTTPIANNLEVIQGDHSQKITLVQGENLVKISIKGDTTIVGKLDQPFIPMDHEPDSNDARELGICLKKISLQSGTTIFDILISELGYVKRVPSNASFKVET